MAKSKRKQAPSEMLRKKYATEIPEGPKSEILGACADLKEPSRSKCIAQHTRAFKEDFDRKRLKKERKQKGDV